MVIHLLGKKELHCCVRWHPLKPTKSFLPHLVVAALILETHVHVYVYVMLANQLVFIHGLAGNRSGTIDAHLDEYQKAPPALIVSDLVCLLTSTSLCEENI